MVLLRTYNKQELNDGSSYTSSLLYLVSPLYETSVLVISLKLIDICALRCQFVAFLLLLYTSNLSYRMTIYLSQILELFLTEKTDRWIGYVFMMFCVLYLVCFLGLCWQVIMRGTHFVSTISQTNMFCVILTFIFLLIIYVVWLCKWQTKRTILLTLNN